MLPGAGPASRRTTGDRRGGLHRPAERRRAARARRTERAAPEPAPEHDDAPSSGRSIVATVRDGPAADAPPDQVEALLALIARGPVGAGRRRLAEVAPGRWWLADPRDREAAAAPLADRVEWAVFSLLSTAGPMSEIVVPPADRRASSPATTCPTRRSSGPASRAIAAGRARPTGS